jgi:dTMP kinase
VFVVFEGGDGSGKSVQAQALYRRLRRLGLDAALVAEPGGTTLGKYVRALVTGQEGLVVVPRSPEGGDGQQMVAEKMQAPLASAAELFLFAASRAQLVAEVIKPRLARGDVVIADRYAPSTLAYQGYGRGLSKALVRRVNALATAGVWPDLIVLLDVPLGVGARRQRRRGKPIDRFERETLAFHRRVRRGYLAMAAHDPQRWAVVRGDRPRQEVESQVWERVARLLGERRPQLAAKLRGGAKGHAAPTAADEGRKLELGL